MYSIRDVVRRVNQPKGGFLKTSDFHCREFDDGIELDSKSNINPLILDKAVNSLTKYMLLKDTEIAFEDAIRGSKVAVCMCKNENMEYDVFCMLNGVEGLDPYSIKCACKLSTFSLVLQGNQFLDETYYKEVNPDSETIQNIKVMVERCVSFFKKFKGTVSVDFMFPNGYTNVVSCGRGDYLIDGVLLDVNVRSYSVLSSKQSLRMLIKYVMGLHSGMKIKTIGIFNPVYNMFYCMDVGDIPQDLIEIVEDDILCYNDDVIF